MPSRKAQEQLYFHVLTASDIYIFNHNVLQRSKHLTK